MKPTASDPWPGAEAPSPEEPSLGVADEPASLLEQAPATSARPARSAAEARRRNRMLLTELPFVTISRDGCAGQPKTALRPSGTCAARFLPMSTSTTMMVTYGIEAR